MASSSSSIYHLYISEHQATQITAPRAVLTMWCDSTNTRRQLSFQMFCLDHQELKLSTSEKYKGKKMKFRLDLRPCLTMYFPIFVNYFTFSFSPFKIKRNCKLSMINDNAQASKRVITPFSPFTTSHPFYSFSLPLLT